MRQRELLEFRTPQHPSLGTNNWGGASPMLARNVPKESLEQRYSRLNTVRTRDEIFPVAEDDEYFKFFNQFYASKGDVPSMRGGKGFLSWLKYPRKQKVTLGLKTQKKTWFPRWDPKNRWPQGWC
ncbi:conserved hypothetical protein [Ricinus communis]|uniref:Uncharacterized protein n=1 Tax=Ricinus communis TaxID=3988 RepID=B9T2A4_RICCO|nr:conserved hypothetical protein [Ricinus communis]